MPCDRFSASPGAAGDINRHAGNTRPSPWVARFASLIREGGPVLDVACGGGRHCRYFLDRGHPVTGIDRDLSQTWQADGAELVRADLEDGSPWPLPGRRFAGIVVTNYLYRPLFPLLREALEPVGVLIYETFSEGNERFGRPRNPDHLPRSQELLRLAKGLRVVAFEEGEIVGDKGPAVVQRLCCTAAGEALPIP